MCDQLLTAKEAAELLGVSPPTFNKIRDQYKLTGIPIGGRIKFSKAEVEKIAQGVQKMPPATQITPTLSFTIVSDSQIKDLETTKGVFDLRKAKLFDSYGAVSLLCTLISRCKSGQKIELLIEDNRMIQYLRSIGFFDELDAACNGKIGWDKTLFSSPLQNVDEDVLVPIKGIALKGSDRMIAAKLIELLRKLGSPPPVGQKVAHIIGELCDNALTHSDPAVGNRKCYLMARRFLYGDKNCVILGLADIGMGIPQSLKSNPKYKGLSDERALVEAFRPHVSSWNDDAKRGKGLADVLAIAWGNKSLLRVDSGTLGYFMDFEGEPSLYPRAPMASVNGTRFGITLLENEYGTYPRDKVDELVKKSLEKYEN